jgi:hypothetical protein
LLKSHSEDREFLVTLGCEGGLPLRLLRKENAHLSRYFRELLTEYHRECHTPGCDATDMARRVAVRYFPASLRHDIVFKLSGDLICSVVKLQAQVAETANPITFLDCAQPQWRDDLPLPVEDAIYRCEGLRRGGVRLLGSAAMAGARLLLNNANEEVELPTLGGQELGPLPWVFVERDTQWEWCGEGSVRSRDVSGRVLAQDEGRCIAVDEACEPIGSAPDLQRSLYQLTGTVEWQHPELGTCQIRCASQDASEESFLVDGKVLSAGLNLHPPFLGMPSLYAIGRDEMRRRINGAMHEWRPLDAPESGWRTDAASCAGRVWVRYRDASGTLRFRRQVEVLPATARIEMARIGASAEEAGIIRLTGVPAVWVTVPEVAGCHFQPRPIDSGIEVDCFAQPGLPVTQFSADLRWPDGPSLTLTLPFPRQGAAFVRAGQVLPPRERVALGRLAALQAVVHTSTGGGRFSLAGRVNTRTSGSGRQELRESLHTAPNEPLQFALHLLQERLASMLAVTSDLDAVVTLEIVNWQGHALAHLEVAQFDVALEPDRVKSRVVLPLITLGRLNDGWEERITVKILPLWDPSTEPINLGRDKADIAWRVPDELTPGPWWVLGYDRDWARFRPLLWVVQGEKLLAEGSELMQAIHEPVQEMRQAKLQALVSVMAANAEHPD